MTIEKNNQKSVEIIMKITYANVPNTKIPNFNIDGFSCWTVEIFERDS